MIWINSKNTFVQQKKLLNIWISKYIQISDMQQKNTIFMWFQSKGNLLNVNLKKKIFQLH